MFDSISLNMIALFEITIYLLFVLQSYHSTLKSFCKFKSVLQYRLACRQRNMIQRNSLMAYLEIKLWETRTFCKSEALFVGTQLFKTMNGAQIGLQTDIKTFFLHIFC